MDGPRGDHTKWRMLKKDKGRITSLVVLCYVWYYMAPRNRCNWWGSLHGPWVPTGRLLCRRQHTCPLAPLTARLTRSSPTGSTVLVPLCLHHCWVASVLSDSVQPHRRQPTRLPRPWDSPGKNTGVGCHFLLQCCPANRLSSTVFLDSTLTRLNTRYLSFSFWLTLPCAIGSRFIHLISTDWIAFFSLAESYSIVYVYHNPFICWWASRLLPSYCK